ncbi:slit robo rho gtpase activating protein 1 [Echinococcus multilocularis]|uniref:Slit robo rho gtpase activating protein 1 n=1 Tax=Echinococcus multilocularis TaxID=6211 RepID=A0A087W1P9_ECHMU|nr:slit robo rho gtpase activating protein 1 [Echinococcus multilocularis]
MTSRNPQKELRAQFSEQLKCLDSKLDLDVTVLSELHEFYRRRALVEQDYSDALAKLVNSLKHKHSNETGKRPNWANYTTTTLWNTLLGTTLHLSDVHATLSEIFGKHMVQRFTDMDEDANRLHKQCREMMVRCQEKVFANISKLQSDQREYGQRQSTQMDADRICKRSEEKLTAVLDYIQSKKKEPEKSQKFRRAQADYNQKYQAYENTILATNHARNEYLIQLSAANQSIHRYFTDEVSDIFDCMSCGLHNSLARAAMMHLSCEESVKKYHGSVGEMINRNITALDWRADKATFLRRNEVAFSRPPAFSFLPFKDDCESDVIAVPPLRNSLAATAADLRANLDQLKASTEEAWNNLQDIEKKLLVLINQNDYDVSELFADPALSGRRRRRQSVSPVNGESGRPVPPSPAANAGGPAAAASYTSLNKGSGLGSGGGFGGGGNTPLSSSLPPEEMGSEASVGSSGTEIQPRLYLTMRNAYREQRIREERIYMERFSAYTQEMHRCVVMQAKLAEIERALANHRSAASPTSTKGPPSRHPPLSLSPSVQRRCPPSLSATPGSGGGDANPTVAAFTPLSETGPETPFWAPPPPPPATTPPSTSIPGSAAATAVQPAALVKLATRRVLQVPNVGRPKLFGGTIDEYVTKTGEQIPRVMLSCIRVINLYGMHHQGVFRVPGSQAEIANFKEAFEYGEDPLVGLSDARNINSTAGLLKLYFRELGEPPFPKEVFMELVKTVREKRDCEECVDRLASIISCGLSHSVFIVMRYLFAFLNHLAEYSDENMMDPYNLAICFGPTLMPAPPDIDQVEFQSNVNDVVKLCINHHRRIFDPTVPGAYYEKFAAYASAVPPVLPRAIASEAVKKVCSLRRQATASTATATAITGQEPLDSGSQRSPYVPGTNTFGVAATVGTSYSPSGKHMGFASSTDRLSLDDELDDDNDDELDSDAEDEITQTVASTLPQSQQSPP